MREMEEKETAGIIFQIYKAIKELPPTSSGGGPERKGPSNWVMSERLKMFEE